MGNKAHPNPKCKEHSEMVLGGQREPTRIRLRRVSVPGSPHPPTGLLVLLLLPRERLVQARVPGRRRELHGAAWGPFPGRHALCAGRPSGGRGPEPVRVGQLQGRRAHGGGALLPSVAPRALPGEARARRGLRGGQVWACGPHGAAAVSVLGGAGEQAEPGVKSLAVTWGKSSKLASHRRNRQNSRFGCVDLKAQPCPTTPPASPAALLCTDVRL